jgi:hypothetical protein
MADSTILIKKINVGTATHFIDAKAWNGYKSTDLKTINGESILSSGGGNIDIVKKAQLDETNAHITENEEVVARALNELATRCDALANAIADLQLQIEMLSGE